MDIDGRVYREKYYYKKSKILPHIYTVCLLINDENKVLSRGVTICSVLDSPNKKEARRKCRDRAVKALATKKNSDAINIWTRAEKYEFTFKDFKKDDHSHSIEEMNNLISEYEKIISDISDYLGFSPEDTTNWIQEFETYTRIMIPVILPIAITSKDFSHKSEYLPNLTENEIFIVNKK